MTVKYLPRTFHHLFLNDGSPELRSEVNVSQSSRHKEMLLIRLKKLSKIFLFFKFASNKNHLNIEWYNKNNTELDLETL